MKKLLVVMLILMAVMMVSGTASAALVGVAGTLLGYPDIHFNNEGTITYTASDGKFVLSAEDLKIVYGDGTKDYLSGTGYSTDFNITLYTDTNGALDGIGTMTEKVAEGSVSIKGINYGVGTTILSGDVYAFGWEAGDPTSNFDFLVDETTLSGVLVSSGIWPTLLPTGILAQAEGDVAWEGSWLTSYDFTKVKGDKAPLVPEPTSMLLLGIGLIGLAGKRMRRKFKA